MAVDPSTAGDAAVDYPARVNLARAARLLGVSYRRLSNLVTLGILPAVGSGYRLDIDPDLLDRLAVAVALAGAVPAARAGLPGRSVLPSALCDVLAGPPPPRTPTYGQPTWALWRSDGTLAYGPRWLILTLVDDRGGLLARYTTPHPPTTMENP